MQYRSMSTLRLAALCFLLPGLSGLIVASMISVTYLDKLPRTPDPWAMRMTPRLIHDITVYQTEGEDRRLNIVEYSSIGLFLIGLGLTLVYLRKWGIARALEGEPGELVCRDVTGEQGG